MKRTQIAFKNSSATALVTVLIAKHKDYIP